MATINEISNAASYVGNASLGGFVPNAIEIDTKPLQDLAKYTLMYNRSQYDQRQKDAELRAGQIADIAALDANAIDPKWRDAALKAVSAIADFVREDPNVFNYRENPQGYMKYRELKSEADKALKAGKTNTLLLQARKEAIANTPDVTMKGVLQKELDNDYNKTGLFDFLPVEQKYDLTFTPLGDAKKTTFDVVQKLPNEDIVRTYKLTDMAYVNNQANIASFDDVLKPLDETSSAFIAATPQEQERMRSQEARNAVLRKSGWSKMGEVAQAVFSDPKFKDENGNINMELILSDPNAAPLGQLVTSVNAKILSEKQQILNGDFQDKQGRKVFFDGKFLKESDYLPINVNDGLSAAEIAKLTMLSAAQPNTEETKIVSTDDANQAYANKTGRINANVNQGQLAFDRDKWAKAQTGGETVKNGAWIKAQGIYADLQKLTDANGVISPDNLRKLNVEQLKYLGTGQGADGAFVPLELEAGTAIQLVNGEIRVLEGAQKQSNGSYVGEWNNTKSTNIGNIATNRLNEELTKSGTKELNTYVGLDIMQNATSDTYGGSSSQSGGTSSGTRTTAPSQTRTGKDGKVYTSTDGVTWIAPDGTSVTVKKK